jgi:hypothetical protein
MLKPGEPAMIITLDIEGIVLKVKYNDGRDADEKSKDNPIPDQDIKYRNIAGHGVLAYKKTSSPTTLQCVTYQTPKGPRTV